MAIVLRHVSGLIASVFTLSKFNKFMRILSGQGFVMIRMPEMKEWRFSSLLDERGS